MKRSSVVLSLLGAFVVIASGALLLWPRQALPDDPLASIPADAYGLLRVRMDRLLASQAWERLVVKRGGTRGIERIKKVCGFNPLDGLERLVVFAQPGLPNALPRFAFSARGELRHTKLIDCVGKLGKSGLSGLIREQVEGIETVRNKKGSTRAAFLGSDAIIAGDAAAVAAAIRSLRGKSANAARDPHLKQLYSQLSRASDIGLVARLSDAPRLLARLSGQLPFDPSPLLADLIALSADANFVADEIRGNAVLLAKSAEHASLLVKRAEALRAQLLVFPGMSLTGFSTPLRNLKISADGARVLVSGTIRVRSLETAIELLPALASLRRSAGSTPTAVPDAGSDADRPTPTP